MSLKDKINELKEKSEEKKAEKNAKLEAEAESYEHTTDPESMMTGPVSSKEHDRVVDAHEKGYEVPDEEKQDGDNW